ncbi:IS66-like element accessory protein TnpA [Sodalis sp. C49]|uniref:IS66-like element accessory protein TnpA n=1 Tax=Sodalis sp. C49 TaxID=3228929 RepID=UPI003965D262
MSSAPRQFYSPELKLKLVQLALQPGTSVAEVARRHNVNDNVLFKWIRLFECEGRVTRRQPKAGHTPSATTLLPVHITENPATPAAPQKSPLEHPCSCEITFPRGRMMLTSPSAELLTVLVRELMQGPQS